MNLWNSKTVLNFIRLSVFIFSYFAQVHVRAWDVDLSRREKELRSIRKPASIVDEKVDSKSDNKSWVGSVFESTEPTQDIVILNTENGFVPETIRLKKGGNYNVHIVNVNPKEKNVSFIMDAFSEHHATYFGENKSFRMTPKVDGIFSFQCPETAKQGRVVITPSDEKPTRAPAQVK